MPVSILMPVRNAGPYLTACLDSILAQSLTDWELIVVNNDSTDESPEILHQYAEKDKRIKLFHNGTGDLIDALRMSWANASGEWITRMDADDLMAPQKLKLLQHALLQAGNGHIATGLVQYFSEEELGNGFRQYEQWLNQLTAHHANWSEIWKECVIASPCWMVNRSDFELAGAYRSSTYPEDYDLCFRFWQAGLKVAGIAEVLHHWRDYRDRASRTDSRYADNGFFALKMHYFLENARNPKQPLVLWGAGRKGKQLARLLRSHGVVFQWVCDNTDKVGKDFGGTIMQHFSCLTQVDFPQLIVAVSGPEDQIAIRTFLREKMPDTQGDGHFFFC